MKRSSCAALRVAELRRKLRGAKSATHSILIALANQLLRCSRLTRLLLLARLHVSWRELAGARLEEPFVCQQMGASDGNGSRRPAEASADAAAAAAANDDGDDDEDLG